MSALSETLLALLAGSTHANFIAPWGRPAPMLLPDDPDELGVLIGAHIDGAPATVAYAVSSKPVEELHVDRLVLAAFCPGADGLARWIGVDLDGADHGDGLADPAHAARCIAERVDNAGLSQGLIVARSRRGVGRHVWLIPPRPVSLADAALALAAIVVDAFRIAGDDVADAGGLHAFRTTSGGIATLGQSGAVELTPRDSAMRPPIGWPLTLPGAGAYAPVGGLIVDPFDDRPIVLADVPRCDPAQWDRYMQGRSIPATPRRPAYRATERGASTDRRGRLNPQTEAFLSGRVEEGARNKSAFAAACNLSAVGYSDDEIRTLVLTAGRACGLAEREVVTCIASALRETRGKR